MNESFCKPITIGIFSLPAHLPVVRSAVEKTAQQLGFDDETSGSVVLSVDEALTNIIKHAYQGAEDQPIEIEITTHRDQDHVNMQIRIRDYGRRVAPEKIQSRDLSDVRPGGLGVHIMNECMDCVEFAPGEGGGTILTMEKRLPVKQEANQ